MHNREEAQQLGCPFMPKNRSKRHVGGGFHVTDEYAGTCIADSCAMWRWLDKSHHKSTGSIVEQVKLGFCGLAGKQPD